MNNFKSKYIIIDNCQRPVLDSLYFKEAIAGGITSIVVTLEDMEFTNGYKKAVQRDFLQVMRRIPQHYRWVESSSDLALSIRNVSDIYKAKKENKVGVIFALQNIFIDDDLEFLEILHRLSVRIIQLTYNERNLVGDGHSEKSNAGLSEFGYAVIKEMNRLGILIDLSHCGDRTTIEAIEYSKMPVICTHANVRELNHTSRNKTLEQIKLLAEKGGVIGITAFPPITSTNNSRKTTIEDFLNHIDYIRNHVGINHIAIGTDFDTKGTRSKEQYKEITIKFSKIYSNYCSTSEDDIIPIGGFDRLDKFPSIIIEGLLSRGYSEEDINKVLGENVIRLFKEVWK